MPRDELYGQCPTCWNAIPRCSCHPEPASDMTTVADAVFGMLHNCRCEETCQAASYIARGETFRCRLTAK